MLELYKIRASRDNYDGTHDGTHDLACCILFTYSPSHDVSPVGRISTRRYE